MGKKFVIALIISVTGFFWSSESVDAQVDPGVLDLIYEKQSFQLSLREIGFDGIDPTTLNRVLFYQWLAKNVENKINRSERSAFFADGEIQPHRDGRKVNRNLVDNMLDYIHFYLNRPVELPVQEWEPPLTTNEGYRLKEKRLSSYTTRFRVSNEHRTHNIFLSAKAIDHQILMPGETFSFNRVVGERSQWRGYRKARIIVKGEYSEGIGGGICQTSSTLYNSLDKAGLDIIQRYSHSKRVTYVPKQRDAAVSWGRLDFCFRNQLKEPIVIVSRMRQGKLTIEIYGPNSIVNQKRYVPEPP